MVVSRNAQSKLIQLSCNGDSHGFELHNKPRILLIIQVKIIAG